MCGVEVAEICYMARDIRMSKSTVFTRIDWTVRDGRLREMIEARVPHRVISDKLV